MTMSVLVPRWSTASSEKRSAIRLKMSQSVFASPGRQDRRIEQVDEWIAKVGRGDVVLLVPGRGRQHDVR